MTNKSMLDEVLDAVEHLPIEQQSYLIEIVQRRLAERGRRQVVADVNEGRAEFAAGNASDVTVDELLKDVTS